MTAYRATPFLVKRGAAVTIADGLQWPDGVCTVHTGPGQFRSFSSEYALRLAYWEETHARVWVEFATETISGPRK